jgi:AraC-like DNA-binding protein
VWFGHERTGSGLVPFVACHRIIRFTRSRPHQLNCDELAFVDSGRVTLRVDDAEHVVPARHAMRIPRGRTIVAAGGERSSTVYWVGMNFGSDPEAPILRDEIAELTVAAGRLGAPSRVPAGVRDAIAGLFDVASDAAAAQLSRRAASLRLLGELLVALRRGAAPAEDDAIGRLVAPALTLIDAGLAADLSVAVLARACRLGRTTFVGYFRHATGETPHAFVRRRRLELARELLAQSDRTVAAVAREVGFASREHLSAAMRATLDVSPAQLRRPAASR